MTKNKPAINGVVETALYVQDLERSKRFYRDLCGFELIMDNSRGIGFAVGSDVFLLFKKGASTSAAEFAGGSIPPHDGDGDLHMAFAIPAESFDGWRERLESRGIAVESIVEWERGGRSLYFRDPDNHCVEMATPGVWKNY